VAGSPKKRAKREGAAKVAELKASGDAKIVDDLPVIRKERDAKGRAVTIYNDKIATRIYEDLAGGMTLQAVCRQPGMPAARTVLDWAMDENHPFAPLYERARLLGYQVMADSILDIADDSRGDFVEKTGHNGETTRVADSENVNRSRLRVEARKWILAKALPKIYGDKIEHTGKDGAPLFPELVITYSAAIITPPNLSRPMGEPE
jgi:hypothetical protein